MINRDSLTRDFFVDPYGTYQRLRSAPPVLINSDADLNTSGLWIFSKYQDVEQVFQLAGSVSKNISLARGSASASVFDLNMLNMDGQDHLKSRHRCGIVDFHQITSYYLQNVCDLPSTQKRFTRSRT